MMRQYYVAMIINGSNQMVVKTSKKDNIIAETSKSLQAAIRISRQLSKQLMLQNATPHCRGGFPQQPNQVVGTSERWQTAIITPRSIN